VLVGVNTPISACCGPSNRQHRSMATYGDGLGPATACTPFNASGAGAGAPAASTEDSKRVVCELESRS